MECRDYVLKRQLLSRGAKLGGQGRGANTGADITEIIEGVLSPLSYIIPPLTMRRLGCWQFHYVPAYSSILVDLRG